MALDRLVADGRARGVEPVAEVNRHRKRLQAQGIDTIAKSAAGTLMRRGDHSGERGETRWAEEPVDRSRVVAGRNVLLSPAGPPSQAGQRHVGFGKIEAGADHVAGYKPSRTAVVADLGRLRESGKPHRLRIHSCRRRMPEVGHAADGNKKAEQNRPRPGRRGRTPSLSTARAYWHFTDHGPCYRTGGRTHLIRIKPLQVRMRA